jgi:hypothetical protein
MTVARGSRKREHALGRHGRVLLRSAAGRAAVAGERDPDTVADVEAGDSSAELVDDPGTVVIGNRRLREGTAECAAA